MIQNLCLLFFHTFIDTKILTDNEIDLLMELLTKNEGDILFSKIIEMFTFTIKGCDNVSLNRKLTASQLIDTNIFDELRPNQGMYLHIQLT